MTPEQHLLRYVQDLEVPCPVCGYNLHQLTRPSCPECGHALKLGVRSVEPVRASWVLLLVGLAMAAGPGLIAGLMLSQEVMRFGVAITFRIWDWAEILLTVYVIAAVPMLVAALLTRRWFCTLPLRVQHTIALAPMALNLVIVGRIIGMLVGYW